MHISKKLFLHETQLCVYALTTNNPREQFNLQKYPKE